MARSYVQAIRSGDFRVRPNGDCPEHCPYQRICRVDRRRLQVKAAGETVRASAASQGGEPHAG
ncbi:MAG: hypothetical protein ACM3ZA_12860, partial [Bacillota bacterium]